MAFTFTVRRAKSSGAIRTA